jgi:hypothetical protein
MALVFLYRGYGRPYSMSLKPYILPQRVSLRRDFASRKPERSGFSTKV